MICSYTELKNLIYNSGIGSNIDVGICEEISEAVAKLELYGLNASAEIYRCFKNLSFKKNNIKIIDKSIQFGKGKVIFEGISGLDYFRTNLYDEIIFEELDSPLILIGLGLINNVENFKVLNSTSLIGYVDKKKFFWNENFTGNNVKISIKKEKFKVQQFNSVKSKIKIDKNVWKNLELLSRKILVPESTLSRDFGAGANINDND